jgi:hypothetical protein
MAIDGIFDSAYSSPLSLNLLLHYSLPFILF